MADHLLLDPVLAEALGPLGQQVEPGGAELLAGRLVESGQPVGAAGLGLGVAALAAGGGHLVRQSTSTVNGLASSSSSLASPWWVPAT